MKRIKWEYQRIGTMYMMKDNSIRMEKLNDLGNDGWELCYVSQVNGRVAFFYFKRQVIKKA